MAKVDLQQLENNFEGYAAGPWPEEERLVGQLFKEPPIRLSYAIFPSQTFRLSYPPTELPYWDFMADARRHAVRHAKNNEVEVEQIVADYMKTIFEPTKRFLLGEGKYYDLTKGIVESLPPGPDKRISYSELIRRRFGFHENPARVDILADETGMTAEEVRSLERRALSIMRHPSRSTEVKKYLEARRWEFMAHLFQTGYLH